MDSKKIQTNQLIGAYRETTTLNDIILQTDLYLHSKHSIDKDLI